MKIECQIVEGGTTAVCDWINQNGLAERVVSIVQVQHAQHMYSVFYRVNSENSELNQG